MSDVVTFDELIDLLNKNGIKYDLHEKNKLVFFCKDNDNRLVKRSDTDYGLFFKRVIKVIKEWIEDMHNGRS